MFKIVFQGGRAAAREVVCEAESCQIGKSENNLVVLQGWTVAPHHAMVYRQQGGLFVRDLSTRSGTAVNGERITEPYGPLHGSDEIQIGAWRLTIRDETPISIVEDTSAAIQSSEIASQPMADDEWQDSLVDFSRLRLLHDRLIARIDVRRIDTAGMSEADLRARVHDTLVALIDEDPGLVQEQDRQQFLQAAVNEAVGLGPLEALLHRDDVTEIMVNRHDEIFVERRG
ncbi:FHA domain-containing protein, partial [Thiomonas sp. SCN 64-16]|uniref:FHA domain-containing protein n=1 Tax=Thiomonas sp. SCN 64-16 TaxID=1660151 RepID=UPI000AA4A975